jgi:hypothetical protein
VVAAVMLKTKFAVEALSLAMMLFNQLPALDQFAEVVVFQVPLAAWTRDCIKAQAKTAEMRIGTERRRETRRFAKQNLFFIGFF